MIAKTGIFRFMISVKDDIPTLDIAGLSLGELQKALGILPCLVILENSLCPERKFNLILVGSGPGPISPRVIEGLMDPVLRGPEIIPIELIEDLKKAIDNYPGDEFDAHLRVPAPEKAEMKRPKKIKNKFQSAMNSIGMRRRSYQRRRV